MTGRWGPSPVSASRQHSLLSYSSRSRFSISSLKPKREALHREHVLICFTISINYQVNEIPAHSLGTLPHLFGLLTAAGAVTMFSSHDAWQGILSLALTSRIIPSALFPHRPPWNLFSAAKIHPSAGRGALNPRGVNFPGKNTLEPGRSSWANATRCAELRACVRLR